jgi:hypothetical protein
MFLQFLEDNPVIDGFIVLALPITAVPAGMAVYRRRHPLSEAEQVDAIREPRESRLPGTRMDIAMLVLGLLLALIGWLRKGF